MNYESLPDYDNHEVVVAGADATTGLRSFIAIHNTNLGPAAGATRYLEYRSEREAISDILRLSRLMTYKCALAGVPHGGGKGVIISDHRYRKSASLLRAYAKQVQSLNGLFFTGEDVGMTREDVQIMSQETNYVIGKSLQRKEPSYWAALGVFYSIQEALKSYFGSSEVSGRSFAIKGLGKVGYHLCFLLNQHGGRIFAADSNEDRLKDVSNDFPKITPVPTEYIQYLDVDVYSPCALGKDINDKVIANMKCRIICGGANDQLSTKHDGELLHSRGILYVPDYLANAGGLISVITELNGEHYSSSRLEQKVLVIRNNARDVIQQSLAQNCPTSNIADRLAEAIFNPTKLPQAVSTHRHGR